MAEVKFLETSRVLLNDGEGTEAALVTKSAVLTILPEFSSELKDEWEQQVATDNISPEPFNVEISNNSSLYGGKYFIKCAIGIQTIALQVNRVHLLGKNANAVKGAILSYSDGEGIGMGHACIAEGFVG